VLHAFIPKNTIIILIPSWGSVPMLVSQKTTNRKSPLTPSVEEGPYYTPGSPKRQRIADPGTSGSRLVVEGRVLERHGRPIAHAYLDFWHADGLEVAGIRTLF
jgi:protocatechuate 3,4-dioxygenase beta subunit